MRIIILTMSVLIIFCSTIFMTGCHIFSANTIPTVEKMDTTARSVGTAAALVANMTKIDTESRIVVVDILSRVQSHTLGVGDTFTDSWLPIAEEHIESLISSGKLNEFKGKCIKTVVKLVFKGLDYLIDKRYPLARQYTDLISTAVTGFCDSFIKHFNTTTLFSSVEQVPDADDEAYEYLKDYLNTLNN